MNKALVFGAVVILLVIIVAGAYALTRGTPTGVSTSVRSTVPAGSGYQTTAASTTVAVNSTTACEYGYICGIASNGCAAQGAVYNCPPTRRTAPPPQPLELQAVSGHPIQSRLRAMPLWGTT